MTYLQIGDFMDKQKSGYVLITFRPPYHVMAWPNPVAALRDLTFAMRETPLPLRTITLSQEVFLGGSPIYHNIQQFSLQEINPCVKTIDVNFVCRVIERKQSIVHEISDCGIMAENHRLTPRRAVPFSQEQTEKPPQRFCYSDSLTVSQ
jgi:hypothetical protein